MLKYGYTKWKLEKFENVSKDLWLVAIGNYVEGKAFELVMSAKKKKIVRGDG